MKIKDKIGKVIKKLKKDILYNISNNKEAVKFLVIFISLSIIFFLIYYAMGDHLDFLKVWTAEASTAIANLFGMNVALDGVILSVENINLEIIDECTGIFAIMINISCILAYPTQLKEKTMGILIVFPLILSLNLVRILFLIYVGKYHPDMFEFVHSYLWQGTFIIFIILTWFIWIELVVKRER